MLVSLHNVLTFIPVIEQKGKKKWRDSLLYNQSDPSVMHLLRDQRAHFEGKFLLK